MGAEWSQLQSRPTLPRDSNSEATSHPIDMDGTNRSPKSGTNYTPSPSVKNNDNNTKLPHNYEAIVRDSDPPLDKSSETSIYQQLRVGVYLNERRKKYWVDKEGNNTFMIFANGLRITWIEEPKYWKWDTMQTSDHGQITVAKLIRVCWLEVHGIFHTANLSPGVTYRVAFLIMLESKSSCWDVPVTFRLTLPNGSRQEHRENLKQKPKGQWLRIPVGQFKVSQEHVGEIDFAIHGGEGLYWKTGLIVQGAIIEPKYA